jgi:hypothetical protein
MENKRLKTIFNTSHLYVITSTNLEKERKSGSEFNKKLSKQETQKFDEIVEELENDFRETGLNLNFTSRIIINETAMNLILLEKILFQSYAFPFLDVIHKDIVLLKKDLLNSEYTPMNKEYNLHPFFEKMFFKIQKRINEGLKQLGLLPSQQIEKQKLTIIKKLRQKYEQIDKEYSIKAEKEVITPKKKAPRDSEKVCVEVSNKE